MTNFLFDFVSPAGAIILSRYAGWMVALSYFIAVVASILAMHLADLATQFQLKRDQKVALLSGAIALGAAVWSMHFLGMLAFELCVTVKYAPLPTLLSILPAFVASWAAMRWISHTERGVKHLWLGGVIIGLGIGVMHYSGMLAIRTAATMTFKPWWVMMSVVVAVLLAVLALWFRQQCERLQRLRAWRHLVSGLVMGAAITLMHYVGMAAATFVGIAEFVEPAPTVDRWYLSTLVTLGAMTLIGAAMAQNMIARQRQLGRDLQFKEHQMRVIFQNSIDAIVITDAKGFINMVNRAFEGMFGYQAQLIIGKHISKMIPDWKQLNAYAKKRRQLDTTEKMVAERKGFHADGHEIPLRIALTRVVENESNFCISFLMDMTAFHTQQNALEKLLTEDPLTGLFNRRGLLSLMRGIASGAHAHNVNRGMILLFLDLDGFKAVNDQLGHAAGDEVLITVSQRIPSVLREDDMVCRYGGDEFVILLTFTDHPETLASKIADKLIDTIQKTIRLQSGQEITVGCSIGVAFAWPQKREEIEALLQKADAAMYQAKKGNAGKVIFSSI
ncbi:diguanylate cyclase domain-containing protein [Methylophilus sp. 5]|uniref:diguanylate cyclase domain-containing protein n=1 Tax=Methylophilus sp. 5 TaxID=1112274 RepID=UPI001E294A78|nr:diguanylate cyclase [Methylophilus sp. 5]